MNDTYNDLSVVEHYISRCNDGFVFMNVNSLDVIILDDIEKNIIKVLNKHPVDRDLKTLNEKYGELMLSEKIYELLRNGVLTKKVENIETDLKDCTCDKDALENINYIDVLISEACNLECKYCFVKNGKFNGKSALMKSDVGEKTIDFLVQKSGSKKDLFICFFGGEPLINFSVLESMVTYALEEGRKNNKHFHFSLTTNGTLLRDEVVEFIGKHQIQVLISIDGDRHSHNQNRPFLGGGDSYSKILENLKKLKQHNISYSARTTVTSLTKNKIGENYEHLSSLGFKKIHFENALAPQGSVFITNKKDVEEIKMQYSCIAKKLNHKIEVNQYYNLETLPLPLEKIVSDKPNLFSCNAGKGYVSIDVSGDIYLCHRLVGEQNFYLGNVIEGTYSAKWSEIIRNEMNFGNRKKCRKCWARYVCGGGCYEINYNFNKDIFQTPPIYCQLMKYNIKLALNIHANSSLQMGNTV